MTLWQNQGSIINFEFGTDLTRANNLSDPGALPRTPPVKSRVALELDTERWHALLEEVFVNSQYHLADFESATANYKLLNSSLSYEIDPSGKASIYLEGSNLTEEAARVHTSVIKDITLLRGRSLLLGFRSRF